MIRPMFIYRTKKTLGKVKKSLTEGGFTVLERRASQMIPSDCAHLYGETLTRSYCENKIISVFDEFERALPEVQEFLLNKWDLPRVILSKKE